MQFSQPKFFGPRALLCALALLCTRTRADLGELLSADDCSLEACVTAFDGVTPRLSESFDFSAGAAVRTAQVSSAQWEIACSTATVPNREGAVDVFMRFTVLSGTATETNVGVQLRFGSWTTENYVFFPGAVYDGNRFNVSGYACYPPFIEDPADHRLDLPITITRNPHLEQGDGESLIELTTGDGTTPCLGFQSSHAERGFLLLTPQQTRFGNSGLTIRESDDRTQATFTVSAPHVRKKRYKMCGFADSEDRGARWEAGDDVRIHARLHFFEVPEILDLFAYFSGIRKDLWPGTELHTILPLSEAAKLAEAKWNRSNWYAGGNSGFYNIEGNNGKKSLGWCGDGVVTHAFLMTGSEQSRQRAHQTLNMYLPECVSPSGLFYTFYTGSEWIGDACRQNKSTYRDFSLSGRHGEVLYFLLKQIAFLDSTDDSWTTPPEWDDAARSQSDALVAVWEEHGQLGQWINCKTGAVEIGNSTSASLAPGALACAARYFNEPRYMTAAQEIGRHYYTRDLSKGYTGGGSGDNLQSPDARTGYHLLESYVTLYELTGESEWLHYATQTGHYLSSWHVSYNYVFPPQSTFGRLGMKTMGSEFACTQNKCATPGYCVTSGDCLWKLYRATGDSLFMTIIRDMVHNFPQYLSRDDRKINGMSSGTMNERIQMSDWEGWCPVGETFGRSCPWTEAALMLTYAEMPGLYAQCDKGELWVLDNIEAEVLEHETQRIKVRMTNPTGFPATVRIYVENEAQTARPLGLLPMVGCPTVDLASGETKEVWLSADTARVAVVRESKETKNTRVRPVVVSGRKALSLMRGSDIRSQTAVRITDCRGRTIGAGSLEVGEGVYVISRVNRAEAR